MALSVKLESFEGPLDLLLHLIDINKFNIFDIPIVEITAQYMEYLKSMESRDLNVMSEFLVMAATLLEIKAKMLLPAEVNEEGEETDPREELVQKLLEYKMYKCMSYELKDRQIDAQRVLFKVPTIPREVRQYEEPVNLQELMADVSIRRLNDIFKSVMRKREDKIDPIRSRFGRIEKEEVSLEERMDYLEQYALTHRRFSFRGLLEAQCSKMEIIVTFLSILELMKVGKIHISQEHIFDDIFVESRIAA